MKLMRKLEKQALARAAKEARKQQGKRKSISVIWLGAQGNKFASIVFFCLVSWSLQSTLIYTGDVRRTAAGPLETLTLLISPLYICTHLFSSLYSTSFNLLSALIFITAVPLLVSNIMLMHLFYSYTRHRR